MTAPHHPLDPRGVARSERTALESGRVRVVTVAAAFALLFLVLAGRLVELAVLRGDEEPRSARTPGTAVVERADIVDRNGVLLATNLRTASAYANPLRIIDPAAAAEKLARAVPGLDRADLVAKFTSGRSFVWIKRSLPPAEQAAIHNLGIPGVAFQEEQHRLYPQGRLGAHVLGYTDVDNHGIAGVEKGLDGLLRTPSRELAGAVRLSLDIRLQHVLTEELAAATAEFSAIAAIGLIVDVNTGEILTLVSLPDFDPNNVAEASPDARFNRATLGVYEMGSTFKAFTVAMALDSGAATLASRYDATQPLRIARFTINDYHAQNRWLTVPEIFEHSSNIGAARIALDVGTRQQQAYLRSFGLLDAAKVELPEVGAPMYPRPWREINTVTASYGHGVAVSPVQLAQGFAALANGGLRVPLTLLRRPAGVPVEGERVLSAGASRDMRYLMHLVVSKGTGSKANAPGYLVGGKTGTAEKTGVGGYKRKSLLSSFVGVFPVTAPRYAIVAILDEPKGTKATWNYATGGWTAAPVVGRVVSRIGPLLGMRPLPPEEERIVGTILAAAPEGGARASY